MTKAAVLVAASAAAAATAATETAAPAAARPAAAASSSRSKQEQQGSERLTCEVPEAHDRLGLVVHYHCLSSQEAIGLGQRLRSTEVGHAGLVSIAQEWAPDTAVSPVRERLPF